MVMAKERLLANVPAHHGDSHNRALASRTGKHAQLWIEASRCLLHLLLELLHQKADSFIFDVFHYLWLAALRIPPGEA